jgi:chromosome segregation ATPase
LCGLAWWLEFHLSGESTFDHTLREGLLESLGVLFLGLGFAALILVLLGQRHDTQRHTEQLQFHYEALSRQLAETQIVHRDLKQLAEAQGKLESLLAQQTEHIHRASQLTSIAAIVEGLTQQIRESAVTRTQVVERLNSLDSAVLNIRYDLSKARTINYSNRTVREQSVAPLEHRLQELEQEKDRRTENLEQLRKRIESLTARRDEFLRDLDQELTPGVERSPESTSLSDLEKT